MKKLLYLVLTLLTVLAVFPLTTNAEELKVAEKMDLIFTEPVEGATPSTKTTVKFYIGKETVTYENIDLSWEELSADNVMQSTDVFKKDNGYVPVISDEDLEALEKDLNGKGYKTDRTTDVYYNNKSTESYWYYYINGVTEANVIIENVIVGNKVSEAKETYLFKFADGTEEKVKITNNNWHAVDKNGDIQKIEGTSLFESGRQYTTSLNDEAIYLEGTKEKYEELFSKIDINTKLYINGKVTTLDSPTFITPEEIEENPNTLDTIETSIIVSILSLTGLLATTYFLTKKQRAN